MVKLRKVKTKKKLPKERKLRNIEKELWQLCRQLTFLVYGRNCYTCHQKNLTGMNLQCGHGYPNGALGACMSHDLRILRPQCFNCNINHGGMGATFWKNLERDLGKKEADELYAECRASKGKPIKAREHFLKLIGEYKNKLNT